jgi:quinol monooxygenase YgiN
MTAAPSANVAAPLTLVSVTRFRLRAVRFMPFFMLHANRAIAQIRKANGFLAGAVQRDADQAFWTLTVWRDEAAMRAYGASGAHRKAMTHLAEWADEASVAHWLQPGGELPAWPEAVRRLRNDGRSSALRHPGSAHADRLFADPRMTYGMRL